MKKSILLWQFAGATFTAVLGTILHFLFEWTNNHFVASFSAVNESTWEHMKILCFPAFVFAIFQYFFFKKDMSGFWMIKLKGLLLGLIAVPILFYTLEGTFGKNPAWLNIAIFFISIGVAFLYEGLAFKRNKRNKTNKTPSFIPFIGILFITFAFVIFTYFPPRIPLFKDPIIGLYGIL